MACILRAIPSAAPCYDLDMRCALSAALAACAISATASAAGRVVMYGASWCGPCRTVKAFLTASGVAFQYLDIDQADNRAQFDRVTGDEKGIPLVLVDEEKIRGARL